MRAREAEGPVGGHGSDVASGRWEKRRYLPLGREHLQRHRTVGRKGQCEDSIASFRMVGFRPQVCDPL